MTQKTMWSMENTPSRFIRTTWLLSAVTELKLQVVNASIRRISVSESASLAEYTRKRNVFARHAGENSFYFQRAKQLADKTVVEVFYTKASLDHARTLSEVIERCFRHQLLLPRPYLVLTKPLRLDIQCQRGASVKIGWKYLDD